MSGLPILFRTGIPTIIMVLKQKRENTNVLIVDASKGFEKVGKNNRLRASDIKRITDVVTKRLSVDGFSRVITRDEIRSNDYNLNIPRYVDSSEKPESWDIYSSMFGGIPANEISDFDAYWEAFPRLKEALFSFDNSSYARLKISDIKNTVAVHPDVTEFIRHYTSAFDGFDSYLSQELVQAINGVNISKEEAVLSDDIFRRLHNIPLVDAYEAYQILDNNWYRIAIDLEIIQTEGFASVKQVDPNMVIKKKNGKDQEVQDGWIGHVLPFELVQTEILSDDLTALKKDEDRLTEIISSYEEALEELPDEEKDKDFVNDDKTAFVWAEVKKAIKAKDLESDVLAILKKVYAKNEEEKKLKKQIKDKSTALHIATKTAIEELSDDDAMKLLHIKWIDPLVNGLSVLPESIIANFSTRLEKLAAKYDTTLSEVEEQISQTEKELSDMMSMLTGNDFDMQGIEMLKTMLGGA